LAVLWLHEEYRLDFQRRIQAQKQQLSSNDMDEGQEIKVVERYPSLFMKILNGLKGEMRLDPSEKIPGLDPRDRNFTRFLIDVPVVTDYAISEIVRSYCDDPQRYSKSFLYVTIF
jgi:hypothetical protein